MDAQRLRKRLVIGTVVRPGKRPALAAGAHAVIGVVRGVPTAICPERRRCRARSRRGSCGLALHGSSSRSVAAAGLPRMTEWTRPRDPYRAATSRGLRTCGSGRRRRDRQHPGGCLRSRRSLGLLSGALVGHVCLPRWSLPCSVRRRRGIRSRVPVLRGVSAPRYGPTRPPRLR